MSFRVTANYTLNFKVQPFEVYVDKYYMLASIILCSVAVLEVRREASGGRVGADEEQDASIARGHRVAEW